MVKTIFLFQNNPQRALWPKLATKQYTESLILTFTVSKDNGILHDVDQPAWCLKGRPYPKYPESLRRPHVGVIWRRDNVTVLTLLAKSMSNFTYVERI